MRILTMYKGYKIFTHHGVKSVYVGNKWHENTDESLLKHIIDYYDKEVTK